MVAAPPEEPPFAIDVEILEEDTYLVLSASTEVREVRVHPIRLMTALHDVKAHAPGSAVVKGSKILAVVHELSETPTTTGAWIEAAAKAALAHAKKMAARAVAMQMLGSVHNRQNHALTADLLASVLSTEVEAPIERVWLMTPVDFESSVLERL